MANLKDIKRKISSVQGTQKTTRAMKLVSSAKLKRTEEIAKRSKVYATKITELLSEIAQKMQNNDSLDNIFLQGVKNPKTVDIVFITADKGLCGGFNYQTIKNVSRLLREYKEAGVTVRLSGIGKKGIEFYRFNNVEMINTVIGLSATPTYEGAVEVIHPLVEDYINGKTDKIVLIHNSYVNIITQEMKTEQLLPVDTSKLLLDRVSLSELEVEPDEDDTLLEALVKRYVDYSVYYALISSLAAEHSSRMQAMDAATTNAKEMVKTLSVKYNKARQEAITTELIEIISGMESMK
ncbi:MAG: F0F1 ATP synthase subunit gamma [Epsilonproteobacteria bacterium]|nr:F0F1 ATP synthase subunit gamma [Campylobacterota bacterium]MBD3839270.1 F0F1 ATP synthase subunit gamma [Campylobacterota bacterium]